MRFQRLTLNDLPDVKPFFVTNARRICDSTAGGTFMWRDLHTTEFAIEDGVLYLRAEYTSGRIAFAPPRGAGGDMDAAIARITEHCVATGDPMCLCPVSGALLDTVRAMFPDATEHTDPAWSDYLYDAADLRELAGRRYGGQRNHINKFTSLYTDWRFVPVDASNIGETRDFFVRYAAGNEKPDYPAYGEGNLKAIEVAENWDLYGQVGGILYAGNEIAGVAVGEAVGDTLFVHTEKALTSFTGAYPVIVREFARMFAADGIKYINREEDDGVEGLRTSKLSYHPVALLEKYAVEWRI